MSSPGPSVCNGYPELSNPVDVDARLSVIEAELAINKGLGYGTWDRCMAQNASVLSLVSDVFNQEVVSRRDQIWKNIAGVVQQALPFYVDKAATDFVSVSWAFHDWQQPLGERNRESVTDLALTTLLYLGSDPDGDRQSIGQAGAYAAEQPTFKKHAPQPVLGVAAHEVRRKVYQFQPAELLQRASEAAVASATALTASFHDGLDYRKPVSTWRMVAGHTIASARDRDGSVGRTQLLLNELANPKTQYGMLVHLTDALLDKDIVLPRQTYEHLHAEYTEPHQFSLETAEKIAAWLSRDMVAPVTPGSLPPKA